MDEYEVFNVINKEYFDDIVINDFKCDMFSYKFKKVETYDGPDNGLVKKWKNSINTERLEYMVV